MELDAHKALHDDPLTNDLPEGVDLECAESNHGLLFFLLGISSVFTASAMINAIDFFQVRCSRMSIGADLSRSFHIPFCVLVVTGAAFTVRAVRVPILVGLVLIIAAMIVTASLILANIDAVTMYWCVIGVCVLCAVCSAILIACVRELVTHFGSGSAGLVLRGNRCCGVIASGLRVVTKASLSEPSERNAASASYFFLCAAPMVLTLVVLIVKFSDPDVSGKLQFGGHNEPVRLLSRQGRDVAAIVWPEMIVVFVDFVVTWTMFPGYLTCVRQDTSITDWTPVVVTTLFYVFSWLGKYWSAKVVAGRRVFGRVLVALRLLFFPIFMVSIGGWIDLADPVWTFCWIVPFALSDGYGTAIAMSSTRDETLSPETRRHAHYLLGIAMNLGLLTGIGLTWAVKK